MSKTVKLGSRVVGIHNRKRFSGTVIARVHPLPGIDMDVLYRVELPNGRRVAVTAHEFAGKGNEDAKKIE